MLRLLQKRAAIPVEAGDSHPATVPGPEPEDALRGLVRASLAGSSAAQRTLLTSVGSSMLQMIRRVLGARDPEVEDIFQEAALGLIRALPAFRESCSTRHFACRIALLTALKARRTRAASSLGAADSLDQGRRVTDDDDYHRRELVAERPSPSEEALAGSQRAVLRRMLDDLPETQATVLLLHCVGGFSVEEVARTMATPLETTRSRLRLAKATLREMIAADPAAAELLEVTS